MERWLRSCRAELLNRTLIVTQAHLLRALREHEDFYNRHRPHRALHAAAPLHPLPTPITKPDSLDEVLTELEACAASHQRQSLAAGELLLHVRRLLEVKNSNFVTSAAARRRTAVNPLYMHPDDLTARGLADGAQVDVRSAHSSLTTVVRADATQLPGTVSLHHSWGTGADNRPVTALIDRTRHAEAHNFVPRMNAIPVIVSRSSDS